MNKILRLSVFILTMMITIAANAEDYTLKVGVNKVAPYVNASCTYTATSDGKVLVELHEVWTVKHGGKDVNYTYVPASKFQFSYEIADVKAGDVITVANSFPMFDEIKITTFNGDGALPVEVLAITPAQGKQFVWYSAGMVSINFNKNITLKSIKLIAGDYTADVDDVHMGTSLGFNITNALNQALNTGKLNPGDKFQIQIKGLCEQADTKNLYNGDGVLTIEFLAPYPQHDIVKATVNEQSLSYTYANDYTFLSYYPKDGADGLFVIEFDDNVKSVGSIILTMGNMDLDTSGKFHRSSIPYTIEDNKILVDARGTLRTIATLFPAMQADESEEEGGESMFGTLDLSHLTITISNVLDSNGNPFRSVNPGSIGSYSYVMNYKEIIENAYLDGDNHGEGDAVNGNEEIRIWLNNPDIKFDGIEVLYFVLEEEGTEDIEAIYSQKKVIVKDFEIIPDDVEGEIIVFNLPEMADAYAGSNIRVALNNASSNDGMPHYLYIDFKASGVADAINALPVEMQHGAAFRLNGVKMNADSMNGGIYIVNGKKVYVK